MYFFIREWTTIASFQLEISILKSSEAWSLFLIIPVFKTKAINDSLHPRNRISILFYFLLNRTWLYKL